ncbi:MAG TPA: hypothetical protein VGJ37_15145 [Pyrinomonadaceae bacterium]|jgi:hypothetical protein
MIRRKGAFTGRVLVVALTLAFGAVSANAYTIVMRDGRRVEIPDEFTVTGSMLTYETSPGIQVTIQLRTINVDATERANGAPRGSFVLHSSRPNQVNAAPQTQTSARRSITNADLEEYRRARIASEKAYEKRRKELGLPSVETQRQEVAAVTERTQEQLRNRRGREEADEAYWRERATVLRTDMAANEAQIDFVRQRLNELPVSYSFNQFTPIYPFAAGNLLNPGFQILPSPFNRRRFNRFVQPNFLTMPFQNYDYSYERQTLTTQLNDLSMQGAALQVRWKEFEEEARRAGAYPGWLRP